MRNVNHGNSALVSKEVGEYVCGVAGPLLLHRGHEVDELLVDLVTKFPSLGGPAIDNFPLLWGFVELAGVDVGTRLEEFVEEGRVEIGVDVGLRDQSVVGGGVVALGIILRGQRVSVRCGWGLRGRGTGDVSSGSWPIVYAMGVAKMEHKMAPGSCVTLFPNHFLYVGERPNTPP